MKKILIVCNDANCRGAAAEFVTKDYLKEIKKNKNFSVISKTLSKENVGKELYPPMDMSLTIARINFTSYKSVLVTKEDIKSSNYIFYIDEDDLKVLENKFGKSEKYKPIYIYAPGMDNIEDPSFTGRNDHVIMRLKCCIKSIFENIK